VPVTPKTVVYLRPDTIGDLILFQPALSLFLQAWPAARHILVVREGYEGLAPLFPAKLEWKVAHLNPFKQRPSECESGLRKLLADLDSQKPDLILAPTLNRTWLEIAVAGHFRGIRSLVLGSANVDPIFAASLRIDLGVDPARAFAETVAAAPELGDVDNQHRFAETVIGRKLAKEVPSVEVPAGATATARAAAARLGLPDGGWAAVFAGGLANVAVKAWPTANLGEVAAWIRTAGKLPVLVLAHKSERALADEVVAAAAGHGAKNIPVWLGGDGELPVVAALLREALFYVGIDTGAMHMAAAVGRPVVGVFGGGHWPRFKPSARQAVSVVQPLPCFGCNWDCHFGNGPCVKTIPAADVIKAVDLVIKAGAKPLDSILESRALPPETVAFIGAATPGIASLKRDRVERQHKIEELKSETDSKDVEIEALKVAADERKTEMEAIKAELEQECAGKDVEIAELKSEADSKDSEIADLKRAADERKTEMEAIKAELEQECADKDAEIAELKSEADSKDSEIEALKATCNDREAIVVRLDAGLKAHLAAAGARDRQIAELRSEIAEKEKKLELLAVLPSDALMWAQAMNDKDVHIRNLDSILSARQGEIDHLKLALENYASGYAGTEQAKHYGKLLAEKEAVIRELHNTCIERGVVIGELSAGAKGPMAALRRLYIGAACWFRDRVSRPLSGWLFKTVVEDYWMQIGILRQYEPRPIVWDSRISGLKGAPRSLPKIGIVTPSFEQHAFIESTIVNILNQDYPNLLYVVQDGASRDASPAIIARHASRLRHWASEPDKGQADAIRRGFAHIEKELGPNDIMAWFNSDDLVAPRALGFVASYFAAHPEVDVIYGHRIIIDEADREIGRWILPKHEPASIEWIDYVPQETLFWRKKSWDMAGGVDPSFQFALDWDLLARFQRAGCRIVRIPYFLGCFRVHSQQKTSQSIHTTGAEEMARIRQRFHGSAKDDAVMIERHARRIRFRGAITARLLSAGIRW
jgi:ADP-heptose:LPS heptosyltransferase/GT2 family glycosyltransferase